MKWIRSTLLPNCEWDDWYRFFKSLQRRSCAVNNFPPVHRRWRILSSIIASTSSTPSFVVFVPLLCIRALNWHRFAELSYGNSPRVVFSIAFLFAVANICFSMEKRVAAKHASNLVIFERFDLSKWNQNYPENFHFNKIQFQLFHQLYPANNFDIFSRCHSAVDHYPVYSFPKVEKRWRKFGWEYIDA